LAYFLFGVKTLLKDILGNMAEVPVVVDMEGEMKALCEEYGTPYLIPMVVPYINRVDNVLKTLGNKTLNEAMLVTRRLSFEVVRILYMYETIVLEKHNLLTPVQSPVVD
jgi:hypothetical protein